MDPATIGALVSLVTFVGLLFKFGPELWKQAKNVLRFMAGAEQIVVIPEIISNQERMLELQRDTQEQLATSTSSVMGELDSAKGTLSNHGEVLDRHGHLLKAHEEAIRGFQPIIDKIASHIDNENDDLAQFRENLDALKQYFEEALERAQHGS